MALVVKGNMPTCCDKCFFNLRCPAYARQVQKIWESKHEQVFDVFGEMRLSDCPLVEIPDEHGRLKDERVIIENMGNAFEKLFPLDGKHKQTIVSDCHVEFMRAVFKAPTIIDATPVDKLPKEWYDTAEDGLYEENEDGKK